MHIVGRSPQKANESALECNAQLTVHNGLIYEISSEIKSSKIFCSWCEEFQTRTQAYSGSRMTLLLVDLLNFL